MTIVFKLVFLQQEFGPFRLSETFIEQIIKIFWGVGGRAVVVAQLVEQSFPNPEVCGSNPVISKNLN